MSDFVPVLNADALSPGRVTTVTVNGHNICLANHDGTFYALDNRCPHKGGQLGDGKLSGCNVICPLHQWDFDVRTGVSPYNPNDKVATYPLRVKDGQGEIDAAAVPPIPVVEGYLKQWERSGESEAEPDIDVIHKLAMGGGEQSEPMRTTRKVPGFDSLYFLPGQLADPPLLDDEPVATEVVIGPRAGRPLRLALLVYISHMSFGALSREAKIALAKGAAEIGTMNSSGEGGMLPEEREAARTYVLEMASGYFGWNEENIRQADAVEIKIGQSTKTGLGGVLPGAKVTDEIAQVRGIEPGEDAVSPVRFPDIATPAQMRERIEWIRKVNPGIPVGVKFAASRLEADLAAACELGVDFITIDGRPGGTGASPLHIKDHVGIPTVYALPRARRWLDSQGMVDTSLCVTGGFRTPPDIAKALALGADAVATASAAMMAIGCQQYRACNSNHRPVGIATQREELRARFDIEESTKRLINFLRGTRHQLIDFAGLCGHQRLADLCGQDLVTYDSDLARYTGIRHAAAVYES